MYSYPLRAPVRPCAAGGGGVFAIGEPVRIIAGAAIGKSGVVVSTSAGVATVAIGAELVEVLADYLAPIKMASPGFAPAS